jgi:2-polyprenyl-3-methyl-5-hydroxy-6-metoxy-1,4-benzoquinol methylase
VTDETQPANPWLAQPNVSGADYDAPYLARAQAGEDVHGEADAVRRLRPNLPLSLLDAGCGTGRIGIELARRGVDVVGVDLDQRMLGQARRNAPQITWHCADLAALDLGRRFDVVLLAGNVMLFVTPGSEPQVVQRLARHLAPAGLLIAGFQLNRTAYTLAQYDAAATAAGLVLQARWATWDGAAWGPASDYAVSIHTLEARD